MNPTNQFSIVATAFISKTEYLQFVWCISSNLSDDLHIESCVCASRGYLHIENRKDCALYSILSHDQLD